MLDNIQCVVLSHQGSGTPHLTLLRETNPWLAVSVWQSVGKRGSFPNCDRNIRDWAKASPQKAERILFLEYDVRVSGDITEHFTVSHGDVEGAWVLPHILRDKHFAFGYGLNALPDDMRNTACVLAPLAVLVVRREALEYLTSPQWDELFEITTDSEVRLPSVFCHGGFSVVENPTLTHVRCQTRQLPKNGDSVIRHPVKPANA